MHKHSCVHAYLNSHGSMQHGQSTKCCVINMNTDNVTFTFVVPSCEQNKCPTSLKPHTLICLRLCISNIQTLKYYLLLFYSLSLKFLEHFTKITIRHKGITQPSRNLTIKDIFVHKIWCKVIWTIIHYK